MSRRVLVIDDNAITRKLVRATLEGAGLEIEEAESGAAAVAAASASTPDLVLQDVVLPDVDGFVLLERLRAVLGPQIPILAFTGLLSKVAEARLGASGFDDVIAKPIEPTRLREIVRGYFPARADIGEAFGAGRRLILADDDPLQRKLATYRLSRLGFEVIPARDGEEALALARSKRADVIVSDVLMPRMDGFELCARVRSDELISSIPVVLLTNSYLEERDFELARRVGADGYVVRSPELTDLAAALRSALASGARREAPPRAPDPGVQEDRVERALRQLERQVSLNASLAQRNAMLSAELAILEGLTSALAEQRDPDAALDTALRACFDAGGISWGALLVDTDEGWSRRAIGISDATLDAVRVEIERALWSLGPAASAVPRRISIEALRATEARSPEVLLVPIVHADAVLGVLLLGAGGPMDEHRVGFASVIAGQIAQMRILGSAFRALQRSIAAEGARVRLLGSVLDAIEDPIVVVDPKYRVAHSNQAAARIGIATRAKDPREWPRAMDLHLPDQQTLVPWEQIPVVRALRGENVAREELVVLRPGESPIWLSGSARPVVGDDGTIESAVAVIRDVTAEKLAQAREIVADRMASIGMLAAGVVHEINNPLSALIVELELAIEDAAGSPIRAGLETAREAAERVRLITRDLKTLSRGDRDEVALVDLRAVLDASLRLALAQIRPRALVVSELDPVPPIAANESRLGQVFLNLLVNAAQAIPPGRASEHRVTVRCRSDEGGWVVAEVADTGQGMTPEVRARLFTPFFTTKPVGVGSGLGLSISHRIVEAAGGRIEVESAPGQGTTFRVRFPVARTALVGDGGRPPTPLPSRRRRVLAVADDPLLGQTISRALRPAHDVVVVSDAAAALRRLASRDPVDVLVLDWDLPAEAAPELRERISREHPDLLPRVVVLAREATARSGAIAVDETVRWIAKPLSPRALVELVATL